MRRIAETVSKLIKIGTRKSKLALAQSTWVKTQIEKKNPDCAVELVKITTKGDKILDVPLAKVGGKGLFVKEIEEALLRKDVDIAVHSLKDVPTEIPQGLEVSVFPEREDPRDAFLSKRFSSLDNMPEGSKIGTSSLRRMAQIKKGWPRMECISLRGNLDTRIRKLEEGEFDAIILAVSGLKRLGLQDKITEIIPEEMMVPAVGQGALGIEFRSADHFVRKILAAIHHEPTAICVNAERAFLETLEGGCQVPIGARARLQDDGSLSLEGLVADEPGERIIRQQMSGSASAPEELGKRLGQSILDAGGREILMEVYGQA